MKLSRFKNPETERLVFTNTNLEDVALVFASRSSPIVRKYIIQPLYTKEEEAVAHINKLISYLEEDKSISWTLINKVTNEKIGSICLWNFSQDRKTAEVGYDLLPEYFRKGYMSEALQAVIKFGLNDLNLSIIEAFTHIENESSKKLLVTNGFVLQPEREDPGFPKNSIYILCK
ncbi:GNAT family N-acetyltransferase [Lacinutrix sp. Bg11-31]|uniref:GNAT family N-acetyltransferase n=1 Tax=Lacinutrix sp. Bg11-31 TaxID=2057808 RepID=UPI000C3195AC|nr:GNAT family N-acetyltransferase [Lacinutrix sp. Bg11-31]AUC83342.1 N-acetyltransferase [Lacinutrix sp. Bg11-31]